MDQVPLFLMAEAFAVGNEELEVAHVRLIDRWIVNLIDDPVGEREPKVTARVISRAKAFLSAVRPARWTAGRARRDLICSDAH